AHHHAAGELGARGAGVEDPSGGVHAEQPAYAHLAGDGVHGGLGEVGPEGVPGVRGLLAGLLLGVGGGGDPVGRQRTGVLREAGGQVGGGLVHGPAPGRGAGGAAGQRGGGQIGGADVDVHGLGLDAERVGGDLGQ